MCVFAGYSGEMADGVVYRCHHPHAHQLPQLPHDVSQGAGVEQTRHGASVPKEGGQHFGSASQQTTASLTGWTAHAGGQEQRLRLHRTPVVTSDILRASATAPFYILSFCNGVRATVNVCSDARLAYRLL